MEGDSELEPLAGRGDLEADQGGVLTGEEGGPGPRLTTRAERRRSLVKTELVILQAREHFAVQLPPVEQLREEKYKKITNNNIFLTNTKEQSTIRKITYDPKVLI